MKFLRKILFPFSWLYHLGTSIRNYLFNNKILKETEFDIPIIVVGNLSVGGTGKTPQIEYLIRLLATSFKVAVLSRGYKRESKGFILADEHSNAKLIGDEPFQYHNKFKNIYVAVDANRVNGIQQLLLLNPKPDVILLDDAFQHRKVKAGLNILLTAFNDLYSEDFILPAGNLRESRKGANRAHIIVVTKCPEQLEEKEQYNIFKKIKPTKNQQVYFSTIAYNTMVKGSAEIAFKDLKNYDILLITGIANPKPLTNYLKNRGIHFKHLEFSDHHNFTLKELNKVKSIFEEIESNNKIIVTTEKDYVRIFDAFEKLYYIPISVAFINKEKEIQNRIKEYVEQSSGNS